MSKYRQNRLGPDGAPGATPEGRLSRARLSASGGRPI